jgi:type II pantothenate kinase
MRQDTKSHSHGSTGAKLEPFCRLSPHWSYLPCHWDFSIQREAGEYYIHFFRGQFDRSLMLSQRQAVGLGQDPDDVQKRVQCCRREFNAYLDELLADPAAFGRPTMLSIDYVRDGILRDAGFFDPYYELKHHDNELVLQLLPEICRDIDAHAEPDRLQAVIHGALAGNIFDMGVPATAERMMEKTLSFIHTRDQLPTRPWLVDDFDLLARRMLTGPAPRKAVLFVDNAGADFVLGMLPLARYLAQRGAQVLMVGNELPTLNDMTLQDMREVWQEILAAEPSIGDLPITLHSSGTGAPLIDLSAVSPELNRQAADADLVVIEGMGRALESNFFTRFDCDVLKIAMIKDEYVAKWLDGKLYDVVCRFKPQQ